MNVYYSVIYPDNCSIIAIKLNETNDFHFCVCNEPGICQEMFGDFKTGIAVLSRFVNQAVQITEDDFFEIVYNYKIKKSKLKSVYADVLQDMED